MARTYHLRVWTRFHAPMDEVWRYVTDAQRIRADRRPLAHLSGVDDQALTRALRGDDPAPLQLGARLTALGILPGPAWTVDVVDQQPGRSVTVRSSDNPLFHEWEHERSVQSASDACRYMDKLTFTPRSSASRVVARAVEELFIHAHWQASRQLDSDARATGVAMLRLQDDGEPDDGLE